ncbi:ExeM/NucH family extracellular endonuclease [Stutzerimonas zhaodongensis]|uniref:ExeM/NucH family extracellular endonuclease n=1 Tax=Stutzerimonas zhaodongensis TaxID=1176257 RepID=A0A3M2HE24_9GAMM|nr:ExeM/NucH family extracellular endonuclease [Stutzerimonas zhaodongensis]MCQ4318389.1 ExeM/NucH family extracellular endonuclease [Stutzerimonas zhaodongensis]RMH87961.1 ExeM/NucH family extracellular endonuclease [Stutzerimonas zhaodongensis]
MRRNDRFKPHPLTAALLAIATLSVHSMASADLLISEYLEGSGNNKALEFYNTGETAISLDGYRVDFYFNGSTSSGRTIALTGDVAPSGVHVLAHESGDPALQAKANQRGGGSWYNGDDAIVLRGPSGDILDSIGQVGFDPGSAWGSGQTQTADRTLTRKASVREGDRNPNDAFDPAAQWQGYPVNTFAYLGQYGEGEPGGTDAGRRAISEVQGAGDVSPLVNQTVIVEGIVVADFQAEGELGGFFIQAPDNETDDDPRTSEGLYIYGAGNGVDVQVGDRVRVRGLVTEFNGLTELTSPQVSVLARKQPLPSVAQISLPLAAADALERYEGMQVRLTQTLTVSEVYDLGRYGEVVLSSGGRLWIPTNKVSPGEPALRLQAQNDLNRIVLDDGRSGQNPDPIRYPSPELDAYRTLRVGYEVTDVQGVLHYLAGSYRIQPTQTPKFVAANPRPASPQSIDGRLRVASFNVLNYFNGDGRGAGFPTSRGANTREEFDRQRDKIIAAILGADAHIIGLMEIENDGYSEHSAIADLVAGLNAASRSGDRYAFIDPKRDRLGTDQIAVGLIYRQDMVSPHKDAAVLDGSVDPRFNDTRNRPVLAQTFRERRSGERLTVAVNHLKSKGSSCDDLGDKDMGDGQGNCNLTRVRAAQALVDWLGRDPTRSYDPDRLIIGDLNAYAKEDPINVIRAAGYTDLLASFGGEKTYSYVFTGQSGYLDHGLASASLAPQVRGATEWHINADEPRVLDYNLEFKTPRQQSMLYSAEPYRASDHDPLVIGIDLGR